MARGAGSVVRPAVLFTLDAHPSSGIVEREPWRAAPRPRYTAAEIAKAPLGFFALGRDGLPPTRCRILREPSPSEREHERQFVVLVEGETVPRLVAAEREL